jgi:hypothetical protein
MADTTAGTLLVSFDPPTCTSCEKGEALETDPPITVTFSSIINRTASSVFHLRIMTILLPPKKARMSHDRQPVT